MIWEGLAICSGQLLLFDRTEIHQKTGTTNNIIQLDQGQLPWSHEQVFIKCPIYANSILKMNTGEGQLLEPKSGECF